MANQDEILFHLVVKNNQQVVKDIHEMTNECLCSEIESLTNDADALVEMADSCEENDCLALNVTIMSMADKDGNLLTYDGVAGTIAEIREVLTTITTVVKDLQNETEAA